MALQEPGDLIESMDEEDLKEKYFDLWKKTYGKKQAIESDDYWDNRADYEAENK